MAIKVKSLLIFLAFVLILILSIGAVIGLQSVTMIEWWIPLSISAFVAAATGTVLWRYWAKVTGVERFLPNFLANFIFATFLIAGLFYTLNYAGASDKKSYKEEAMVMSKYREIRHRSQRVGRNRYVTGAEYNEYYISVKLDSGKEKNLQLPYSTYQHIKQDKPITLSFSKGLFFTDVINISAIPIDNPPAPEKRKRCRFFGTSGK